MQCALKIKSVLLIILTHILLDVKAVVANPSNNHLLDGPPLLLNEEVADSALKAPDKPLEEEATQVAKTDLPLVKVAHRDVMDLLHLFFVAKTVHLPSYVPLVQHVGVRINWFQFLKNLWSNERKSYGGGVDLHFRGPIQLSVDLGYLDYQPKAKVYGNEINYSLKGSYGLVALLYAMDINLVTHGYFGVGYGYSRFNLMTADRDHGSTLSNPLVVGWIKLIGGSELRLMPQIYGGMGFGIAYLLHGGKNEIADLSTYTIPGYGQVGNRIVPDITLYLKWRISLLEKKIVI